MALYEEEVFILDENLPKTDVLASVISSRVQPNTDSLHLIAENAITPRTPEKFPENEEFYRAIGKILVRQSANEPDIIVTSDNTITLKNGEIRLQGDSLFVFNALLAYRDRPQRAEEIRALGFHEKANVIRTRQHFVHTINSLIKSVNTAADSTLIEKNGVTKGTRYQLAQDAEIRDDRNVIPHISESTSYIERERVVNVLAKKYQGHPYIEQRLYTYRDKSRNNVPVVSTDELHNYLQEVGRYRLLTREDEIELFGYIEAGLDQYSKLTTMDNLSDADEKVLLDLAAAREIIFNTNLRLAVRMSQPYWRVKGTMSEIDIIQEANLGLAQAIPRMKIEKGFKFSTYASTWIRQSVGRAIANKSREIRIPTLVHEKYAKAVKQVRELSIELGREPTNEEIEVITNMSWSKYIELLRHGKSHLVSLNKLIDEDGNTELGDLYARDEFVYEEIDASFQQLGVIKEIISKSTLTDRQLFVIGLRYGIHDILPNTVQISRSDGKLLHIQQILQDTEPGTGLTINKIGELINLSGERIRQIEHETMGILKKAAKKAEIQND